MKIGDEVFVHGFVDEIRVDQVIINNRGGYFGTLPDEVRTIVQCKDCRYWQDNNGGYPHEDCRWGKDETPEPTDFCSYGERRY